MNNEHTLYIIAHPDDELITFGHPLLLDDGKKTVICVTSVLDEDRNCTLYKVCEELSADLVTLGVEDVLNGSIWSQSTVNTLTHVITKLQSSIPVTRIITHCLVTGDMGAHQHHKDVALMVRQAACNLATPIPYTNILHKYAEGFILKPVTFSLDRKYYSYYLHLLDKYYAREIGYLDAAKYRLTQTADYYTVKHSIIENNITPRFFAYEHGDFDVYSLYNDPCNTRTCMGELHKRGYWLEEALDYLNEELKVLTKYKPLKILDIGTGPGYTTNEVLNNFFRLDSETDIKLNCFDKYSKVCGEALAIPSSKVDETFTDYNFITAFQVLYWMPKEEFEPFLNNGVNYLLFEGISDENKSLLKDRGFSMKTFDKPMVAFNDIINPNHTGSELYTATVDMLNLTFAWKNQ